MTSIEASEARWAPSTRPDDELKLRYVSLSSQGRRYKNGFVTEMVNVLLASNGKIYRMVTTMPEWEDVSWEVLEQ